jgi:ApbE superfamily uncharacterized protein (UPF0280 family)
MTDRILLLGDDTVLVEYGPMRMFIDASLDGVRRPDVCAAAADKAIGFLKEIAAHKGAIQSPHRAIAEPPEHLLTHVMWKAVSLVGDDDLTPMAAVAGTIADAVADFLEGRGLTKIVVNNGGDVAIRLRKRETATVGIRPDVNSDELTHRIVIDSEMAIGGVCTSGLGGRSFTRGIASAATVFANRAAIADAAASSVANATYIECPAVIRVPADSIDPNTDLKGVDITAEAGKLTSAEIDKGIQQGIRKAEELVSRQVIAGACVAVKGRMDCTRALSSIVERIR